MQVAEARLRAAMIAGDVGQLDQLIDDRLVFVGSDGRTCGNQDDLELRRIATYRLPCSICLRTLPLGRHGREGVSTQPRSIRARRAKEDRSFAVRGRAVAARWPAVPHMADLHGGTDCRAGCRLDGADSAYAERRRPAPRAASQLPRSARRMTAEGRQLPPVDASFPVPQFEGWLSGAEIARPTGAGRP
jgi:hypothetical protein